MKHIPAGRVNITISIFLLSLFSLILFLFRVLYTRSPEFIFLNWNLFLAFIPFLISSLIISAKLEKNKVLLGILIIFWILFFPNSPYILTDLFHLDMSSKAPEWFDLVLILSYAWTALICGAVSLMDIEKILKSLMGKSTAVFLIIIYLFLSGFGIYLGRYLRWNSWNIFNNPRGLLADILEIFSNPLAHTRSWGLTILIGTLLNLLYFSFKFIKMQKE